MNSRTRYTVYYDVTFWHIRVFFLHLLGYPNSISRIFGVSDDNKKYT
jgi:hypothetical protein